LFFRAWVTRTPFVLSNVVYSFLRLIEDHMAPQFDALRSKEATFVVSLLREKISELRFVGRDLVRALHCVARVPEIEAFWKDLILNPNSVEPGFTSQSA
jgi:integrator complex subunit 3